MRFNEAKKIIKDALDVSKEVKELVTIMGAMAINHYKKSFRDEGFTDDGLVKWQKRSTRDRGRKRKNERGILTQTGRLRRSLVARKNFRYSVTISSNVPYAKTHNEGLTIKKKESSRILNFKISKDGRSRFSKAKKANFQQDVTIGKHRIKMPKRQFVGYSGVLARKIEKRIGGKIRKIFK